MPILITLFTLALGHAGCPDLTDRGRVAVSPRASLRAQELLGLNLLSAADRLRLSLRREGAHLRLTLDGGRILFDVLLNDEGRATLEDAVDLVTEDHAEGLSVALEVSADLRARFERGPATTDQRPYRVLILSVPATTTSGPAQAAPGRSR